MRYFENISFLRSFRWSRVNFCYKYFAPPELTVLVILLPVSIPLI